MKISQTLRSKRIDNFKVWRKKMRLLGRIKSSYPKFKRSGDLAELIGVVLGDGNITKFPRTEGMRIVANSANQGFVRRYARLIEIIFQKRPSIAKRPRSNAVNISIYECNISKRLGIPCGAKGELQDVLPKWIKVNRAYIIRYLRGLYEAEGSHCVHKPTYTYKFLFSNTNPALLRVVYELLHELGFHPHRSHNQIQISRKEEVQKILDLLQFRRYNK